MELKTTSKPYSQVCRTWTSIQIQEYLVENDRHYDTMDTVIIIDIKQMGSFYN